MRTIAADRLAVPGGELPWTAEVSHGLILAPGWPLASPRGPGRANADAHYDLDTAGCSWNQVVTVRQRDDWLTALVKTRLPQLKIVLA
jgi:hypothetical protein